MTIRNMKKYSMQEYDHIQFRKGLPFYEMVMSFTTSLSAVFIILNNHKVELKEKDYVSIEGKWVKPRHFFPYDVVSNIKNDNFTLYTYINSCCCMLANSAYEAVKEKNDKSPEFEFLRHIRNASSHQNMFNFFPNEPSSSAFWKEAKIDHKMKGKENPLYGTECFGSFFGVPDIIDLLKEIEEKIKLVQ
ncbi:hypothetical protein IVG45_10145 [Methylomonas sp. LL1]|uniref:hypothetical protein n=1 Tax=Methylomonas sp. LL1 TaxID=2785785 RepID=UPI0018C44B06|nr:hypothetical protein [Methylomonas sp. LL1]QPK65256.1 hypothetical protein IVG45_10145 [Methylomonas sp. LL1]